MTFGLFAKLPRSVGRSARCLENWPMPVDRPTSPEKPSCLLLPVDDVDDAGHAGRVKARRGIVDDLDRLDVRGRHAVEPTLTAKPGQTRLPTVDEDGDTIAAAQGDHAFLIDGHAGEIPHRIEQRAGGQASAPSSRRYTCVSSPAVRITSAVTVTSSSNVSRRSRRRSPRSNDWLSSPTNTSIATG